MGVSYEKWTAPRWARTTGGVDEGSPEVIEPASQQKNVGWLSTDTPVREWWNWMWREAYKGLLYLSGWFEDGLPVTTLARSGKALLSQFDLAVGTQQVAIDPGTAFIDGKRYEFPTTVVLSETQFTQATMHRIVVATLVGSTPTITRVDGITSGVDPVLAADEIALWRIEQLLGDPTFTTTDLRKWGRVDVDELTAETVYGQFVMAEAYEPDGTEQTTRYLRHTLHAAAMKVDQGSPSPSTSGMSLTTASDQLSDTVSFPPGSTITKIQGAFTTDDATNDVTFQLLCRNRITGAPVDNWSVTLGALPAANYKGTATVDHEVAEDEVFLVMVNAGTNHDVVVHSVVVEFTNTRPFASFGPVV